MKNGVIMNYASFDTFSCKFILKEGDIYERNLLL